MKKYRVTIVTTFVKEIEVEAESEHDATQVAYNAVWEGEVDGTDTDNLDTDVTKVEEIK